MLSEEMNGDINEEMSENMNDDMNIDAEDEMSEEKNGTGLEIAVIGMAGRFPGAANIDEFWQNIRNGVESISFFTDEELEAEGISSSVLNHPSYVKARGALEDIESFDFSFFGYIPAEADMMDPQVRMFHECAWEALENAGYTPGTTHGLIGLFAGAGQNVPWTLRTLVRSGEADFFSANNLAGTSFSTLISYRLNLKGASVTVQSACSTSLTAIHLACRSILTGEVDIAMAGGISLTLPSRSGYMYKEGHIVSRDGHCRAFDADATGTVTGDGVGIVVLKPLASALEDGDHIYAVILGSAANNDGDRKVGYTAPSVEGQSEVIVEALELAEIEPAAMGYIETHGTGTNLGDPVEIEALKLAYGNDIDKKIAIGSVKSNVGHLDRASGVTGFIKVVLSLYYGWIPPSLHFSRPNPRCRFEDSPFYVNTQLTEWPRVDGQPRIGSVSSFGVGGTNVHIVLQDAPVPLNDERIPEVSLRPIENRECMDTIHRVHDHSRDSAGKMLLLSAKTLPALERMTANLANFFKKNPGVDFSNAAYTLQVGRDYFKHRRMMTCGDTAEAVRILEAAGDPGREDGQKISTRSVREGKKRIIFMFPGQGSQYAGMGKDLYRSEPVFREELDKCFDILDDLMDTDAREILFPKGGSGDGAINRTQYTQPSIFAFSYALARLLMEWGIIPYAMTGHSIGEYVAACLSGVFSLEDALRLVVLRGKLMQSLPEGDMLSVPLSEEELKPLLEKHTGVELAAVNTPERCVVSGTGDVVKAFASELETQDVRTRVLHTSHAFHSRMMEPILEAFEKEVAGINIGEPGIPYISNITGTWITAEQAADPGYWAIHLRRAVRFSPGVSVLAKEEHAVFIEVGPGKALNTFMRQHPAKKRHQPVVNLVRHPDERIGDMEFLQGKMGELWLHGVNINWKQYYRDRSLRRIPLPAYPFEKNRISVDTALDEVTAALGAQAKPEVKHADMADWFYIPSWKRLDLPGTAPGSALRGSWLILADESSLGGELCRRLKGNGSRVVLAEPGTQLQETGPNRFTVDRSDIGQMELFIETLEKNCGVPEHIIYILYMYSQDGAAVTEMLNGGFYGVLNLARALGKSGKRDPLAMTMVTSGLYDVTGVEEIDPLKAVAPAVMRVLPKEYPFIRCRTIDLDGTTGEHNPDKLVIELAVSETLEPGAPAVTALRGRFRWVEHIEPVRLNPPEDTPPVLKNGGVYLITGGFGGMGFTVARFLAKEYQARIILTSRSPLPPREQWDDITALQGVTGGAGARIGNIRELENLGAEVSVFAADSASYEDMSAIFKKIKETWGNLDGVFHTAGLGDYAGLIQLRDPAASESVLAPKINGTLILDRLFTELNLEPGFLVLYSSLSAYLGPLGQVAYTAANGFLDAFARWKNSGSSTYTVSINWDSWRDVGMAVRAVERFEDRGPGFTAEQPVDHPIFDARIEEEGKRILVTRFHPGRHWMLDEHRILGTRVLVGTAYLEIAASAFKLLEGLETGENGQFNRNLSISEFNLFSPLAMDENGEKEVRTILEKRESQEGEPGFVITVSSRTGSTSEPWQLHAKGFIGATSPEPGGNRNIAELQNTIGGRIVPLSPEGKPFDRGFIAFGGRWDNARELRFGQRCGIVDAGLAREFDNDTRDCILHPALMDVALSFLLGEVKDGDTVYLPFSFRDVKIFAPLPSRVFGYNRLTTKETVGARTLDFDVTLMDETGAVTAEFTGFTVMAVSQSATVFPGTGKDEAGDKPDAGILRNAITPDEGNGVLIRVLASGYPQVLVSTVDWEERIKRMVKALSGALDEGTDDNGETREPEHSRPELSNSYVPPGNGTEKKMATVWQNFFKIGGLGVMDDFFELGGDSLKALSLLTRIHKSFDVEIPMADFFNAPTIRGASELLGVTDTTTFTEIEPVEMREYYPTSSAQARLFLVHGFDPSSVAYNIPAAVILEGQVDKERLTTVFDTLVKRHEIFRSAFFMMGDTPVQRILDDVPFRIDYDDLSADEDRTTISDSRKIIGLLQRFVRPFDLSEPPLLRVGLVKLSEEIHVFMLDIHHIAFDASSLGVFMEEFAAMIGGNELTPLTLQFKDYALWQTAVQDSEKLVSQRAYWLDHFSGEIPVLQLPLDFSRPMLQDHSGDSLSFQIGEADTEALKNLARQSGGTLFNVFFSVFGILLSKLSGQEDIVMGIPVAGRHHADIERMIGMFVNTLCIRSNPAGDRTHSQYLNEVRELALRGFENQDYYYEDLLEDLGDSVNRDASRNPLFDVSFNMRNMQYAPFEIPGLTFKPVEWDAGISKFDLSLIVLEGPEIILCRFEYCTRLFKRETVERFSRFFMKSIDQILDNPGIMIKDIDIIDEDEKRQILFDFNETDTPYPSDDTLHGLFEVQADKTPGNTALVGETSLTYRELDLRADDVSTQLKEEGIGTGSIVALTVERTVDTIVNILGILKAGAAYLPLSPDFPLERVQYILNDSNAVLLDTVSTCSNGDAPELDGNDARNPAYIIYTSGSTGNPKGVLIEHRSAVNTVTWWGRSYGVEPGVNVLQMSDLTFDPSVNQVFGTLLYGGTLYLIDRETLYNMQVLRRFIENHNIHILNFVPLHLNELLTSGPKLESVRTILSGGERLDDGIKANILEKGYELYNQYGPTEASIDALVEKCSQDPVTLGTPIANTRCYVLARYRAPVPIGVPGELYIGGIGVARGYLNRPEMTAEAFIKTDLRRLEIRTDSDGFNAHGGTMAGAQTTTTTESSALLYKTGDKVRWLKNGKIEFLGRMDFQVKIRGYRVELGEIEDRLRAHGGIKDAVVVERKDDSGVSILCAYVTTKEDKGELLADELKGFLAESLPGYMVPSYCRYIETMPLTVSGKIDRKRLPEPVFATAEYVEPRDDMEKTLSGIFAGVLGVDQTGIDDHFFERGGHSLKAVMLISRVHQDMDIKLTLADLFLNPTVRELAVLVNQRAEESDTDRFSRLEPVEKKEYYPLSPAQKRLYILDKLESGSAGDGARAYNLPKTVSLKGDVDVSRLEGAFKSLIQRHESLRTFFRMVNEQPAQFISDNVDFKVETGKFEAGMDKTFVRPFDLGIAPLMRVGLFRKSASEHVLLVDMHHIVTDGTSQQILIREFISLYEDRRLEPLSLQYKDFSTWMLSPGQQVAVAGQEAFWLDRFAEEIPMLNLPLDSPRPRVQDFNGDVLWFSLEAGDTAAVKALAAEENASMFMVLLAVFNVMLSGLSGLEDIVVGTPVAARRHRDLEPMVGMFVNTLALRNSPDRDVTFIEFLAEVKSNTLDAFENQEYPFEELVDKVTVRRDTGRNPVFDVMFALHSREMAAPTGWTAEEETDGSGKLNVTRYEFTSRMSLFDLSFHVGEGEDRLPVLIEYATALFDKNTIERFAGYFKRIVAIVCGDPGIRLGDIALMDESEKTRILEMSTGVHEPMDEHITVHELFEKQAAITPNHIALVDETGSGKTITYEQLNKKADVLAGLLRRKGVNAGMVTGLMMNRSTEMIVGILAIIKTGSAYLPIDPSLPEQRKRFMLADSQVRVVLVNSRDGGLNGNYKNILPERAEAVDLFSYENDAEANGPLGYDRVSDGSLPLYVIYTSGSTGRPKGIVLEHRNFVNLMVYQQKHTSIDSGKILQFTTISFDVSAQEIFTALLSGGTLYLVPSELRTRITDLLRLVREHEICTLFLPVQFVRTVFSEEEYAVSVPSCVRHIVTAGEQLIVGDRFRDYLKRNGVTLHNHYGPAETHVVTALEMKPGTGIPDLPSIGYPVANTAIYILNREHKITPSGVPGELCIAGNQMGKGYLNNPELTAEKFINPTDINVLGSTMPHALTANSHDTGEYEQSRSNKHEGKVHSSPTHYSPSVTFYKTGDLARYTADRTIEFLGRIDQQVKIRGFRIEPGEVENRLIGHKWVKEAVVMVKDSAVGDKYLAAYVVQEPGVGQYDLSELGRWLGQDLPDYMVPSSFTILETIPLTPSGKVDRRSLPEPAVSTDRPGVEAGNEMERQLTELWRTVLFGESFDGTIYIDDNFFQLGGHSLKATVLASKIHKALNVKIPLVALFKYPTIRGLAEHISETGEALISGYSPIPAAPVSDYYPLSPQQKRLYILQQINPDDASYNMPGFIRVSPGIDREKLAGVFLGLIQRHESLRTSFHLVGGEPVQRIHDHAEIVIEDFESFKGFIRPFDLSLAPLLRLGFWVADEDTAYLLVDMHHIITDGVSHNIMERDFLALYRGEVLEPTRTRYIDYAVWLRRAGQEESVSEQERFWIGMFADEVPLLDLPYDYPRPPIQDFTGASLDFLLESDTVDRLRRIGTHKDVTPFMLLISVYSVILSKLSGSRNVVIGTPTAGRRHADLHDIIGMFVNTLALNTSPTGHKTFREFLSEIKHKTIAAFENQDYPFEELVDKITVQHDPGRNPVFDVMFSMENMGTRESSDRDTADIPRGIEFNVAKFDLTLSVKDGFNRSMSFQYAAKLFKKETVERFAGYFCRAADVVSRNPGIRIADIDILSAVEKKKILMDFNDTAGDFPQEKTISMLFDRQVERSPDAIALQSEQLEEGWTYGRLKQTVDRNATIFRKLGAGPNRVIGLLAHRSPDMFAAMLAILKAGGAYLPLGPDLPANRLNYMLRDSSARFLVVTTEMAELGEEIKGSCGIVVMDCEPRDRSQPVPEPGYVNSWTDLAYVIYTSGTTGKPKGVLLEHRGVVNLVTGSARNHHSDLGVITVVTSEYTFDSSADEFYRSILFGGTTYIIPRDVLLDAQAMRKLISDQRINMIDSVPALLDEILGYGDNLPSIQGVIAGADVLTESIKQRILEKGYALYNHYGPTEMTVYVLHGQMDDSKVTLGKPIINTRCYVLDEYMKPVPTGTPGELFLTGPGMGRGYLNRPELTDEKFVVMDETWLADSWELAPDTMHIQRPTCCGNSSQVRLYRTGDVVRWTDDGCIEFLGRMDDQVKIRGFRIELEEIEARLMEYKNVNRAIVTALEAKNGDKLLCAYVTAEKAVAEGTPLDTEELKKKLSRELPDYMIPSFIIKLEKFPLTRVGKINRKALPVPDTASAGRKKEYVAPESDLEKLVSDTWKEVLGVEQVGIYDNFFDLGGNSLGIIKAVRQLREKLNRDIPTTSVFLNPTVSQLVSYLDESGKGNGAPPQVVEKDRTEEIDEGRNRLKQRLKRSRR